MFQRVLFVCTMIVLPCCLMKSGWNADPKRDLTRVRGDGERLQVWQGSGALKLAGDRVPQGWVDSHFGRARISTGSDLISSVSLAKVHAAFVEDFIAAPKFGYLRMSYIGTSEYESVPEMPGLAIRVPRSDSFALLDGTAFNMYDMGAVVALNDLEARPGSSMFLPQQLREIKRGYPLGDFAALELNYRDRIPGGDELSPKWEIASIELVGLLMHDTPAVYISQRPPRMYELVGTATRPLDEFETSALEQLRAGEEIVVTESDDDLRMLGSLRATTQCIQCHSVNRGELLGAFTYRLRRDAPGRRMLHTTAMLAP